MVLKAFEAGRPKRSLVASELMGSLLMSKFYCWLERWILQLLRSQFAGQIRRLRASIRYATVCECFLMLSVSAAS